MRCPSCGAEVAASRFCENCGSPLLASQDAVESVVQSVESASEPASDSTSLGSQPTEWVPQPTEPVIPPYSPEVPGDSAWEAKPQQAYQVSQTLQMPSQGNAGGYIPPAGSPQPPYQQLPSYQPQGSQAPNAAFVLAIVGLVLSILFITFVPGLVCSIIGLVLNAGYNKRGLSNPRQTSTTVIGVIGIVIAALCLVFTVMTGVLAAQVIDELDRNDTDITAGGFEVTTDSGGHVNISVADPSDSSASSDSAASTGSSSASASSSSSASSSGSSASASSDAASSASSSSVYEDDKYHDSAWNPTLYSVVQLTGSEMADLLEYYNFTWDDDLMGWYASDGSLYAVNDASGELTEKQCRALPRGAAGQPVIMTMWVEGYKTPREAVSTLSSGIVTEELYDDAAGDACFAIVYGPPMVRYLVVATESGKNEQMLLIATEEAISTGYFSDLVGFNVGSSMDQVWRSIANDSGVEDAING